MKNNLLEFKNIDYSFQNKLQNLSQQSELPQIQPQIQINSLTINSDDRNEELYPSSYDFKMIFESKNENIERIKGTIYQNIENITNITKIKNKSVIIPSSPELQNLPYLLLD